MKLVTKNEDGAEKEIQKDEASNYNVTITVKKRGNDVKEVVGVLSDDIVDETCAIYKFILPSEFTDQVGECVCETVVKNNDKELVMNTFVYSVKSDMLTGLNGEIITDPDFPVLKGLIEEVKETAQTVNNIDNVNVSDIKTYSNKKIEEKFSGVSSQIKDIENEVNSLSFYPRLPVESDDYNRIVRALENTQEGGILTIPKGSYNLNGNDLILNKAISIVGQGMENTLFLNGGIVFESSNVNVECLTVSCPQLDNAFQANTVAVSNIIIKNCKGIARDHSFLFESYFGVVQSIIVDNCISMNSTHGFITKAINVTFINCKANNHPSGFGFGVISDNIPGKENVANAISNSIINCEAYMCSSGLRSYVRDKFNSTCVPRCSQNKVMMFNVNKCMNPISIGEDEVPAGYQSIYQVDMFQIQGVNEIGKLQDEFTIKLANTYRCMIDNIMSINGVIQTQNANENIIGNVIAQNKTRPHTEARALTSSTGSLNVSINNCFEIMLNNTTGDNDKISFNGLPKNGQVVTVLVRNAGKNTFGGFDTTNCLIDTSKFNIITSGIAFNNGQITQWMYCPGITKKWLCISASQLINLS